MTKPSLSFNLITEVKNHMVISDYISLYVKLTGGDKIWKALCPFHQEKTASFFVYDTTQRYKCYGCGATGDIINFEASRSNLTFKESLHYLADKFSLACRAKIRQPSSLTIIAETANLFFMKALKNNPTGLDYLQSRNISNTTALKFQLGYADAKCSFYQTQNVADLKKAGLIGKDSSALFADRLIFPIINRQNHTIAFGGRVLDDRKKPKYLNSPTTANFCKQKTLYGIHLIPQNCPYVFMVEGYTDVLALDQAGFNVVAPLGTSWNRHHLEQLLLLTKKIILCADGDTAGRALTKKFAAIALEFVTPDREIRILELPLTEDPASLAHNFGKLLKNTTTLSDFFLQLTLTGVQKDVTPEKRAGLLKSLLGLTEKIDDATTANQYRQEFKQKHWLHFFSTISCLTPPLPQIPIPANSDIRMACELYFILKFNGAKRYLLLYRKYPPEQETLKEIIREMAQDTIAPQQKKILLESLLALTKPIKPDLMDISNIQEFFNLLRDRRAREICQDLS